MRPAPKWHGASVTICGAPTDIEVRVGPIHHRLVLAGSRDPGLEVVTNDRLRYRAQQGEPIDVDADPVRQRLAEADLGVGVVLCPENGDEDLGVASFPCQAIEHRHSVAGKVHEQLLARRVRLAHGRRHTAAPLAVPVAEPAIAVASGG